MSSDIADLLNRIPEDGTAVWTDDAWPVQASASDESEGSEYDDDSSEYEVSDAQKEWEESMEQLKGLFTFVLFPVVGKFFGRRFAYYVWRQYVDFRLRPSQS